VSFRKRRDVRHRRQVDKGRDWQCLCSRMSDCCGFLAVRFPGGGTAAGDFMKRSFPGVKLQWFPADNKSVRLPEVPFSGAA
jgi:hypothetical protein